MSAPWEHTSTNGGSSNSSGHIASPALRGTIVLAQCRSWLLAEEESRCRSLLNGLNHEKHALKTSLNSRSEALARETAQLKAALQALQTKEEVLRRDLDSSSTLYLRLFRDPEVSRANDDMLAAKQHGNELWQQLEELIHERNEITTAHTRVESTHLCIIQNLYQTQVLLQTQQERQRANGIFGVEDEDSEPGSTTPGGGKPRPSPSNANSATARSMALAHSAAAEKGSPEDSGLNTPSALEIVPVSPLDPAVLEEVTKLNQLRNGEITLQKRLSKFLGLREQVQSYLIKIAGFQKALWNQQQVSSSSKSILKSAPSSGRASPSSSLLRSSASRENLNSQPIPILVRRNSGSGAHSVYNPNTPNSPEALYPSSAGTSSSTTGSPAAMGAQMPHQLLKPSARSHSPSPSTSVGSSERSAPSSPSTSTSSGRSSRALGNATPPMGNILVQRTTSGPTAVVPRAANTSPSPTLVAATAASAAVHAERDKIEHTQLANLVFDARNRKVLQRVCENFQRSGLLSSRRYKKSSVLIHNAFLGVELLTWVLNIGISSHRTDALILLELLLRAGLIDMIQETPAVKKNTTDSHSPASLSPSASFNGGVHSGGGGGAGSLRISDRSVFGDMKLQFALYRLRGDSSEVGRLSKSGWLHRVSRWRVTRKYFSWDAETHRFALWNSNKDEAPNKIYYLSATTVVTSVDHDSAGAGGGGGQAPQNMRVSSSTGAMIEGGLSKYYFQLAFHPPQNDEATMLLYASSARERGEWLKILWLSGCEYPALARTSATSVGPDGTKKEDVPPGSRPSPIHPSVLAPGHHALLSSPLDADSDQASETDEDEYEEDQPTNGREEQDRVAEEPWRGQRRYAADEMSDASGHTRGHSSGGHGGHARSSSLSASASFSSGGGGGGKGNGRGLMASASFSGGLSSKRRLSLSEKKHESDLMGIFSLKRAKAKFATQAALGRVHDLRRKNLERRKSALAPPQPEVTAPPAPVASVPASSSTPTAAPTIEQPKLPAVDGLDLGWKDFFVVPSDETSTDDASSETSAEVAAGVAALSVMSPASAAAVAAAGPVALRSPLSEEDTEDEEGDELAQDDSDYNSADELDDLDSAATTNEPAPSISGSSTPANPTTADLDAMRLAIRKQRFQAISLSLTQILAPKGGLPSSGSFSSSSPASAAHHPLTILLANFVRQFHDLYSGALELDTGGHNARSTHHHGWPLVHRTEPAITQQQHDVHTRRPRERGSEGSVTPNSVTSPAATPTITPSSSPMAATPFAPTPTSSTAVITADLAAISIATPTLVTPTVVDPFDIMPIAYPYPRHARAVLAAAKDDVRHFLAAFNGLLAEALRSCEDELREEAARELRSTVAASAAGAGAKRRLRRNDPTLRRIEREFLLLSRLCSQLVAHHVFSQVHRTLFPLYEHASYKKTSQLREAIADNQHIGFKEMGLSEDLIFTSSAEQAKDQTEQATPISYQHAIDTFRTLSTLSSPIDKLQCVVSVANAICACVDQAKRGQAPACGPGSGPSPVVIGADDLLLLFTYLLLNTRVPSLLAELSFLGDFIPDHQRCSMMGYYLATTQAAAELLMSEEFANTIAAREGGATKAALPKPVIDAPQSEETPSPQPGDEAAIAAAAAPEAQSSRYSDSLV